MAEREQESDGNGRAARLHHFASDVINCRDVVRAHRMSQPQAIRKESRSQQDGMSAKSHDCPDPGTGVEQKQEAIYSEDSARKTAGTVLEQTAHREAHRALFSSV